MIEKIGLNYYEKLSIPNKLFIEYIAKLKKEKCSVSIAEIGIGIGATAVEAINRLTREDTYFIFDYQSKVEELSAELKFAEDMPKIKCMGNSRHLADSYVWSLCHLLERQYAKNEKGLFDLVLLDGSHDFTIDLAACALIIELLKPGAYLLIDDIDLSVEKIVQHNPHKAEQFFKRYSKEQLSYCQMQMICKTYLDRQTVLHKVKSGDTAICVYKKI